MLKIKTERNERHAKQVVISSGLKLYRGSASHMGSVVLLMIRKYSVMLQLKKLELSVTTTIDHNIRCYFRHRYSLTDKVTANTFVLKFMVRILYSSMKKVWESPNYVFSSTCK